MPDQVLSAFPDEAVDTTPPAKTAPTAAPPTSPLSAFPPDQADRLTDSLGRASATPPDTAATIFDLQLKTGLPHEVIARNLDDVRKQVAAGDFDAVSFRQKSPILAKWLDRHPLNASVAADDLLPLTKTEHAIRLATNSMRALGGGLIGGLNMGAWGVLQAAGDVLGLPAVTAWAKAASDDAAAMQAGLRGEQRGAGPNERAFYSGFESMGSSAPILATSLLTADPALALTLMGTQTGGQAYTQARAAGVSIPGALAFGTSQGAIEAATEMLPIHALFGDLAHGAGLFKTLAHQAILEVPGEQLATALQDLNEWAVLHPGTPFSTYLQERPSAAVQTLIATLVSTGVQTGAVHTLNRAISGLTAERVVTDLGASVTESQLAARSPAKFQEFLESATKDTPLERVYAPVDTWTQFWQEQGVDPGQMAEEAGSSRTAYQQAVETGSDLALPTAGYATAIAGTEHNAFWSKELRLEPGEMNARESEEFIKAHSEAVTSAAIMQPGPSATQQLHEQLVKQLVERGQMRPQDAETNAAVVTAMLDKFIQGRAGLDARAMFEARTDPRFVERVPGPAEIGSTPSAAPEASPATALSDADLENVLADPVALAALERRQAPEGTAPGTGEQRGNEAALAELEREAAGQTVGAGGGKATLQSLRNDPTLRARAEAFKAGAATSDILKMEQEGVLPSRVTAEFLAHGPDGPLFNIVGGPKHGSTVGLQSLKDLGIQPPAIPADTGERLNGDQLRARMIAARIKPNPLFQSAPEQQQIPGPMFYSRILRAVEESKLGKATGAQWAATIKNYKGGISKDEAKILKVEGLIGASLPLFPEAETVYTKQEALDYLTQNELKVKIVDLESGAPDEDAIERELESMRESEIESEADYLRSEYDKDEEIERIRENFNPPPSKTEFVEGDDEDVSDHYLAYVDGEPLVEYRNGKETPIQFDTEQEADDAINDRISELESDYIDEEYHEPDFYAQARDSVDDRWDDDEHREQAIENLGNDGDNATQYGEYVEDGPAEDYRELFVTAPDLPQMEKEIPGGQLDPNAEVGVVNTKGAQEGAGGYIITVNGEPWLKANGDPVEIWSPTSREQALADAKDQYQQAAENRRAMVGEMVDAPKWHDGHGAYRNIQNPIARLRMNTRETALGKTLFLEEAQPPSKDNQERMPRFLLKNWRELAFKTALRHAVETGHAALAWTTGEEQAIRYALDKKVQQIRWDTDTGDTGRRYVEIEPNDSSPLIRVTIDRETGIAVESSNHKLQDEHVSDIWGDEIEARMAASAQGTLEGEGLRIGGIGLKRLYDKDFVNVVNGLAAVKRAKGKVESVLVQVQNAPLKGIMAQPVNGVGLLPGTEREIWTLYRADNSPWGTYYTEAEAQEAADNWNKNVATAGDGSTPHHAIRITPELATAVLSGQPLFQGENEKRGAITFNPASGQALISLFAKADLSTFQHEAAHLFLELVGDTVEVLRTMDPATMTNSQRGVIQDYDQVLLPFLGVSNRQAIGREQHERFATAWEAYLMEGKAPSAELRPIFSRIKAWLLGVYRNLRKSITLTPEVRTYMDKLLATDDAILAAERDARIIPLFTDATAAGMTPDQFELYRKHMAAASVAAREQLERTLRADIAREQTRVYKQQKQDLHDQVEAELEQQPVYRALAAMREGMQATGEPIAEGQEPQPLKLDRAKVVALIGEAATKTLPRPAIYTREGGVDPAHVANLFGFSSAAELLDAIGTTLPLHAAIAQETERRMQLAHGGMLTDGTLHEQAQEAVANELRDQVIRAEIRALQNLRRTVAPHVRLAEKAKQAQINALAGQVSTMQQTAKKGPGIISAGVPSQQTINETARTRLAATPIRAILPQLYWAAARRSNDLAVAAAAQQEFAGAIHHQTQQLLNLALYRQAAKVLEDVDARVAAARVLDRPASRKRIGKAGATYQDQIDGILDRYEFAQVSQKVLARRASMRKWAAGMEGEGYEIGLSDAQLDDSRRTNYRELTYDELVGVTDGLRQIVHLASLKNRFLAKADQREFGLVRETVVDSIRGNNLSSPLPLEFRPTDESRRRLGLAFAAHRKIAMLARALDGHVDGGAMWENIIRPINAAADAKLDRSKREVDAFSKILETHYPGRELGRLHELLPISAIHGSLSHEARIAVGLNWGTQEGRDRILNDPTRRWSPDQAHAILDTLDARDWSFIRATWAYNDHYWPEIRDQQERVTGIAPDRVLPVQVETKFGKFPGGYYHLAYDGRLSPRAQQNEAATMAKLGSAAAYVRTTTRQGHVEARQQHVRLSVKLDLGVQFAHIEEVIHSLTHREMLSDVTRILRDSHVQRAIYETAGDQVYQQFTTMLEDIAVGTKPATNLIDRGANFMRTGTQIAGLGWNLWTAFQQPLGLFNGASRVGPAWVLKGMGRWLRDAASFQATTTWISEVSPMMRHRLDTATQDLSDLRRTLRQPGQWFDNLVRTVSADTVTQQQILDGYLWHIGLAQRVADVPTWLGQYEKSMAAGETEPRAIALADQAVLDSQGGGQTKDLAHVQRGGPAARLFMTFYSYGSTVLNSTIDVAEGTNYKSPASVATLLGHLSLLYLMPALGTVALAHAFGRAGGGDDDWKTWLAEIGRETASSALNGVVFLRELTGLFSEGTRGYEGPAGARFISLLYKLGGQIKQGVFDEGLWKSANAVAGVVFRYPAAQVQRTVDGFAALEEGRSQNPMVLLTGPPPKKAGQ